MAENTSASAFFLPSAEAAGASEERERSTGEGKGLRDPNSGNGMDLDKYSWTQTLEEVTVNVPVPQGTKSRSLTCEIKKTHLKFGFKGQPPIIDGDLYQQVKTEDCFWSIEDGKSVSILLTKQNQMGWWNCAIKGDPEIDTLRVRPEDSTLSDLDPEARKLVERMMTNQPQESMGLPRLPGEEMEDDIRGYVAQVNEHPEMDISRARTA